MIVNKDIQKLSSFDPVVINLDLKTKTKSRSDLTFLKEFNIRSGKIRMRAIHKLIDRIASNFASRAKI